jgi:hypothetical protein
LARHGVNFVDDDESVIHAKAIGNELISAAKRLARVDHEAGDVDVVNRFERCGVHAFPECSDGFVHPRGVDKDNLRVSAVYDPAHTMPRGLSLVRHDAHL